MFQMPRYVTKAHVHAEETFEKLKAANKSTLRRTIHEISGESTADEIIKVQKLADDLDQDFKKLKSTCSSMKAFVDKNKA